MLSVITPSFNHVEFIGKTIDSVLSQDYAPVEHVIVDGGSTDGTLDLLRTYGDRFPDRVRWISEPDRGQSHALNKGIALARGQFLGWQNSDDYYLPNSFRAPIAYLCEHPDVAMVYGACRFVDETGAKLGSFPIADFDFGRLLFFNYIPNQAAFFRRDALFSVGCVDEDLHYLMDYDLWFRLAFAHRCVRVPGELGALRLLTQAKTHQGLLASRLEAVRMLEWVAADQRMPESLAETTRTAMTHHLFDALLIALAYKDARVCDVLLSKARTSDPGLMEWHYFCSRLLARRVILEQWFAHLEPVRVPHIPKATLELFAAHGLSRTVQAQQMRALSHLFQALEAREHFQTKSAVAHLVRAVQTDTGWLAHGGTPIALLRLLFGDRLVDRLHPVFRRARLFADWQRGRATVG